MEEILNYCLLVFVPANYNEKNEHMCQKCMTTLAIRKQIKTTIKYHLQFQICI